MAGMNVNVWDVTDPIQRLIRERVAVDDRLLADPDVPLDDLVPSTKEARDEPPPAAARRRRVDLARHALARAARHGAFAALIADCAVTGATSNPTIFAKAITGSDRYDEQLRAAVPPGHAIRRSSSSSRSTTSAGPPTSCGPPTRARGRDGFVSFECTPDLADDTEATIEQAVELWTGSHGPT